MTHVVRAIGTMPEHQEAADVSRPHPLIAQAMTRADLGRTLATRASESGLAVTGADGSKRAIPIGALPVIVPADEIDRRTRLAATLVSATAKAARWRLGGEHRANVLAALGPSERRFVEATWDREDTLAVGRVDFLGAPTLQALEVNATIPAMQGYSDIAAESWLKTFAGKRSDIAALIRANGSNALALLDALATIYRNARPDELGRVGLLCRRGDAQLTELAFLRDRFTAAGMDAVIVYPDELTWRRGSLHHDGRPLPLVYRHLFLSRLDASPSPALEAAMLEERSTGTLVLNRPAPHLEMKSTLAVLSAALDTPLGDRLALSSDEIDAVRSSVPWTRRLLPHAHEGSRSFLDVVTQSPDDYVLKRSWSYGGNEVFVGRGRGDDAFWRRVHATYPDVNVWSELVERAAQDDRGGGFVVQRAVARRQERQLLCTPDAVDWRMVTTDYAAYASLGATPAWSGVCRAAASDIVNIVGGGAVVPLLTQEVADALVAGQ